MSGNSEFAVRPMRFWEEYKILANGTTKTVEKMEWTRPGMAHMQTGILIINDKVKAAPGWETVSPAYEAWKKGQEIPESGTPLGAWPGLTSEQANAFKQSGMKTVEDIAGMNDRQKAMVKLPGLERLKAEAKTFLEAKDSRGVELELQRLRDELAALRADREDDMAEAPKRRGRPPRVQSEDAGNEEAA